MGNKIITEKDFWVCTQGAVPAQLQGTRKGTKKEGGELYITVEDKATSSWIDFGCKKYMLLMALIAAVAVVALAVVGVLTVATGGLALVALGAVAGLVGAAIGAVVGGCLCGQKVASKRVWSASKSNFISQGTPTITGDHFMTCAAGGTVKFAPNIKSWTGAIALGALNYATGLVEGALVGGAVGLGGGVLSGAYSLALPTLSSIGANIAGSFGVLGSSVRALFGADNLANQYATGEVNSVSEGFASFGNGAIPEAGSLYRVATFQAQPQDALLLLYLLHVKTPTPKENATPKEEPNASQKEEAVVKPTEEPVAENSPAQNKGKGEAFEDGGSMKPITAELGEAKANKIREELGLKEGDRNVAVADANINGSAKSYDAVSGKNSPEGTVPSPSETARKFTTKKSGAMTRAYDTEVKILEEIAKDLPNDAKGVINLYTERSPCFSCKAVIEQFKELYPNIELNITTSNK